MTAAILIRITAEIDTDCAEDNDAADHGKQPTKPWNKSFARHQFENNL